jgi:hypothetical protein
MATAIVVALCTLFLPAALLLCLAGRPTGKHYNL